MDPQVVAAIIAASVSFLTLVGTIVAQYLSRRATSKQLDRTLEAQRAQLDATLAEQRTRTLNERFATAAEQLGSDRPPAVRLAGVYAMASLADDWPTNRQTCIDVLCAYLRMPYEPDPGESAPTKKRLTFQASREVRLTVIRVISAHLRSDAPVSWQGFNFDFTGAVFDGGSFREAVFSGGRFSFSEAIFPYGSVDFYMANFSGGEISFFNAKFTGGRVGFPGVKFSGSKVSFESATFSGGRIVFAGSLFSGGEVNFGRSEFSGGRVGFGGSLFIGSRIWFDLAEFSGGTVSFTSVFRGSDITFTGAKFTGGTVDFQDVIDWSRPPKFDWESVPPADVKLPIQNPDAQSPTKNPKSSALNG